ncbi:hypothetical protein [Paenibacillus sp. GYB003]|uniref:hypothetical protein n=1 Tax=Paenibacillus sp. GYB003 TaxID=2994392 RepID=UPI002F96BC63
MEKRTKLDIVLLRMGYVAAFFILIITLGAIVVAIINMYRTGRLPMELPKAEPDRLPDANHSELRLAEAASKGERRLHAIPGGTSKK